MTIRADKQTDRQTDTKKSIGDFLVRANEPKNYTLVILNFMLEYVFQTGIGSRAHRARWEQRRNN